MIGKLRGIAVFILILLTIITAGFYSGPDASARPDESNQSERSRYIIQLADPPLASYRGGIQGLAATNPAALGEVKLDPTSVASRAYLSYLEEQQAALIAGMTQKLGRPVEVAYQYKYAFNGMAVTLARGEVAKVKEMPGVAHVIRDYKRFITSDSGPEWIGAPTLWDGSQSGGLPGTKGEGIVIGVIDTGINHDHPSFADPGPVDGYDHVNERGQFYGVCVTNAVLCNDKLIGMYDFTGTTVFDDHGHGSHTASTAGGNQVEAVIQAPTIALTRTLSGVAPHANLISYKTCLPAGCLSASLVAAIDQATADGVDVINYSIGGGPNNPWRDSDAQAFLGARDAGIFVATSAGNSGPGPQTVGSPADSPWVLSVGASTHQRAFVNSLIDMTGGSGTPPADINGKSFTAGYGPDKIVYAGAEPYNNPLCNPFTPGTNFQGAIVVCDRGTIARVDKGKNVEAAGGGGMVLANDEASGDSTVADAHDLPAVHISYEDGVKLKAWLASGSDHMATIAGTTADLDPARGDVMAAFSSRGANASASGVIKPDVTAPGVDVLAAVHTTVPTSDPEYGIMSGTSMSSPHAAGAAALLRALHPEWSPAELQAAMMTTALTTGVRKEDSSTAADPFDMGAGRVDLTRAARAGLVLDESSPNYTDANPNEGGDPTTLNLPSLAHGSCEGSCSWTRVVSSTHSSSVTWTVSTSQPEGMAITVTPRQFTLAPGASRTIQIEADVAGLRVGRWVFAQVTLEPNVSTIPAAHLPVAVLPGGEPRLIEIETGQNVGTHAVTITPTVAIEELTGTVYGMTRGQMITRTLDQDPTPLDAYDSELGTFHTTVVLTDGARLLAASIADTTSTDLDLYVGLDANGDGAPSAAEQICSSASETAYESCELQNLDGGTYWVLVQNWLAGTPPDRVVLEVAAVSSTDKKNLSFSGPASTAAGTPFELELAWQECSMQEGEVWYSIVEIGASPSRPANIQALFVKLLRLPDEEPQLPCENNDGDDGGDDGGGGGDEPPPDEPNFTIWYLPLVRR